MQRDLKLKTRLLVLDLAVLSFVFLVLRGVFSFLYHRSVTVARFMLRFDLVESPGFRSPAAAFAFANRGEQR